MATMTVMMEDAGDDDRDDALEVVCRELTPQVRVWLEWSGRTQLFSHRGGWLVPAAPTNLKNPLPDQVIKATPPPPPQASELQSLNL